jgi:RNA polymerase sigma-70 factor (ECF subfamily)
MQSANGPRARHRLEQLLRQARAGDAEALGRLLQEFRPYLLHIAREEIDDDLRAKIGGSDVVQESFAEAHRAFATFHGASAEDLGAWLREILLNNVRDTRKYFRTDKRDVARELQPVEDRAAGGIALQLQDPHQTPPAHAVVRHEMWRRLEKIIDGLSDQQKKVLQLRQKGNRSFAEIGHEVGVSAEAARKIWARCIEEVRRKLDPEPP